MQPSSCHAITSTPAHLPLVAEPAASHGLSLLLLTKPAVMQVLYVRPDAVFDKSKPISGGIPHCFPQVRDDVLFIG